MSEGRPRLFGSDALTSTSGGMRSGKGSVGELKRPPLVIEGYREALEES